MEVIEAATRGLVTGDMAARVGGLGVTVTG